MKNFIYKITVLILAVLCSNSIMGQTLNNGDFENGSGSTPDFWSTEAWMPSNATFEWETGTGRNNSKSVSITVDQSTPNDARWVHQITGLQPGRWYNIKGWIKGENVVVEANVGANLSIEGGFTRSSEQLTGTFDWTEVIFSFGATGTTETIGCRLGHFGNLASGKVWFDDMSLEDVYTRFASEHIYLEIEDEDKQAITDTNLGIWLSHLDLAYEQYEDLVGFTPFEPMGIASVRQYPGGWAVADDPIRWHQIYVYDELALINSDNENYSFGIIHEISHHFDDNGWNFAPEFFTNFKMYFAVESLMAKVYTDVPSPNTAYVGDELEDMWLIRYNEEKDYLANTGNYRNSYQGAFVYRFIQIANAIGWEPFKQTFRELLTLADVDIPASKAAKYLLFIHTLSKHSGVDVRNLIAPDEMQDFIGFLDPDFMVCSGDISLSSQAEVDAFNCNTVDGDLTIAGNDITNLDALSSLSEVTGNLDIVNNGALANVDALSSLTSICGNFRIFNNQSLINLDGLSSLISIGADKRLTIRNNPALANLDGLSSLTSVWSFRINNNDVLTDITGLSSLNFSWFLVISGNDALTDLQGLSSLTSVGGLNIVDNDALLNLDGLSSLSETQASLTITDNDQLLNIDALSTLTIIQRGLIIENNSALQHLDGLSSLTSVGSNPSFNRFMKINSNASLADLNGLESLTFVGGDLEIRNNPNLTACCGIFPLLSGDGVGAATIIANNGSGCTKSTIITLGPCSTTICEGDTVLASQAEVDAFSCEVITGNLTISGPDITNLDGLSNLRVVGKGLGIVDNPLLTNLDGLSALSSIGILSQSPLSFGGVGIRNNASLVSIEGLSSAHIVNSTGIGIVNNDALVSIDGLPSSSPTTSRVGHGLTIDGNDALTDLNGLSSLTGLGGWFASLRIRDNDALTNLGGLSNLRSIAGNLGAQFIISDNDALTNLDALSNLTIVSGSLGGGTMNVTNNPSLIRCCGIFQLTRIGGPNLNISGNGAGCTVEDIMSQGPCLDFEADNLTVCASEEVTFNITSTIPVANLQWSFGAGAVPPIATGPGPHTVLYQSSGNKTVTLNADEFPPVTKEDYITVNPNPLDKYVVPEFDWGCNQVATNIIVQDYEPGILYQLRRDVDDSPVAGPWPGFIGLYTSMLTETTIFNVLATNPNTGCETEMTIKPTVTVGADLEDKYILAEYPSGPVGHATNVLVIGGEPNVLYQLRDDSDDTPVGFPWPGTVGLYTGPLFETTTFNILAYDPVGLCEKEMDMKVTVTIDGSEPFARKGSMEEHQVNLNEASDIALSMNVRLFPNPTQGVFNLIIQNETRGSYDLIIHDLRGKVIDWQTLRKEEQVYQKRFDFSGLDHGIYLVSIIHQGSLITRRRLALID